MTPTKATYTKTSQAPLRARCTTAPKGRSVAVSAHDDQLVAARARAATDDFIHSYRRWRPMVERSLAWLVADGHRRVRYHGAQRNRLWLSLRVAAVNLKRLLNLGLDLGDSGWTVPATT